MQRGCMGGGEALTAETAAFVTSGLTIVLAAAGTDRCPLVGLALACVADPAMPQAGVRVLAARSGNEALIAALAAGSPVAASFTNLEHRSLQLKAARARIEPAGDDDLAALARQTAIHAAWIAGIGFGPAYCALFAGHRPEDVVAVAFRPDHAFVQTPGPAAGTPLGS